MPPVRGVGGDRDSPSLRCEESYGLRPWNWASWEEMDDKRRWRYTVEGDGGKVMVRDKVEDFFVALDRALVGVG